MQNDEHSAKRPTLIRRYSGGYIDLLNPHPAEIDIRDIAIGLARECRYARQSKRWYSVAEHSWLLAAHAPRHLQLRMLLHDASEAYIGDMPAPIKHTPELDGFRDVEKKLQSAIYCAFGIDPELPSADMELMDFLDKDIRKEEHMVIWDMPCPERRYGVVGYSVEQAQSLYIQAFAHLRNFGFFPGFDPAGRLRQETADQG